MRITARRITSLMSMADCSRRRSDPPPGRDAVPIRLDHGLFRDAQDFAARLLCEFGQQGCKPTLEFVNVTHNVFPFNALSRPLTRGTRVPPCCEHFPRHRRRLGGRFLTLPDSIRCDETQTAGVARFCKRADGGTRVPPTPIHNLRSTNSSQINTRFWMFPIRIQENAV